MNQVSVMDIVEILFWGALSLLYFGVRFQYQGLLIAIGAGVFCLVKILSLFKQKP